MKNNILLFSLLFLTTFIFNPETLLSQALDVESTTEGVLLPRMTTSQRTAIMTPTPSTMVYDTDTQSFWFYEDGQWNEIISSRKELYANETSGEQAMTQDINDADYLSAGGYVMLYDPQTITSETYIEVCINIEYSDLNDLNVVLSSPSGTSLQLSYLNGPTSMGAFTNTCFTTSATVPISSGTSPFTGEFMPDDPFSNLIGEPITGAWSIYAEDPIEDGSPTGFWYSWSIKIENESKLRASAVVDCDGNTGVFTDINPNDDTLRLVAAGIENIHVTQDTTYIKNHLKMEKADPCPVYGDDNPSGIFVGGVTDWSINPPFNNDYNFHSITIGGGGTLIVPSGTKIKVYQTFTNNGNLIVLPSMDGERDEDNSNGAYPLSEGYTVSQNIAYSPSQLRNIFDPGLKAGSNGAAGSGGAEPDHSGGSAGGVLKLQARKLINNGTISATGGDGESASNNSGTHTGAGGGGGGFVLLVSETITNSGTIDVSGGDGSNPGTGADNHAGGGGAGGLIHMISKNANSVAGTLNINGGSAGMTPGGNLGIEGGHGGSSAGHGGSGGTDNGASTIQPTAGGVGLVVRSQVEKVCAVVSN